MDDTVENISKSLDSGQETEEIRVSVNIEINNTHNEFESYNSFYQTAVSTSLLNMTSADDAICDLAQKDINSTVDLREIKAVDLNTEIVTVRKPRSTQNSIFYASTPNNSFLSVNTANVSNHLSNEISEISQDATATIKQNESTRLKNSQENRCLDKLSDYSPIKNITDHPTDCVENTASEKISADLESTKSDDEYTIKSQVCFDSGNERSSHKFFIDFSSLPDSSPPKKSDELENTHEKSKMFNIFVDLNEKAPVKEKPSRLSSALKKPSNKNQPAQVKPCKNPKKNNQKSPSITNPALSEFEAIEALCNDPNISICEIICKPESKENKEHKNKETSSSGKPLLNHKEQSKPKELVFQTADSYVKLSDLDNPVSQTDLSVDKTEEDARMTRSIPDNKWAKQQSCISSGSFSSFHSENALSLNRLFPHLRNDVSKSMPGSLSAIMSHLKAGVVPSPGETDEPNIASDGQDLGSFQSSICPSIVESPSEETNYVANLIVDSQSRLGQDLLRMFLEEIAPDVTIEVAGKRIQAHKCILSSRCQYFARMLSGGWVESAGNVIALPLYSFETVHFVLCYIYSGTSYLPDDIEIAELAAIADLLELEGLKEAIIVKLKATYCHNFHTPCSVCISGVVWCLKLSVLYNLDDLYRKILRWMTKYFAIIWPTKAFATLSRELIEKCYQEHVVNLSIENFLDTVYGCGNIAGVLENTKRAEKIAQLCRRLVNEAARFAAPRLVQILELIATVPNDIAPLVKQTLKDCLTTAIEWAPPGETCKAYAFLSNLVHIIRTYNADITKGKADPDNLLYANANNWRLLCENTLVRAAPRVVGTQAFKELPSDLRKRLRELGCIVYGQTTATPQKGRQTKSLMIKPCHEDTSKSDMDHVRKSFVPYKAKPCIIAEPKCEKKKHTPIVVRTTRAQEKRALYNMSTASRAKLSTDNAFAGSSRVNAKMPQKNVVKKIISSSESSRNTSPVLKRNGRRAKTMSEDSLATSSRPRTAEPSTDSLSGSQNNKYATYTKGKSHRVPNQSVPTQHPVYNRNTKIPSYSRTGAKNESQCYRQGTPMAKQNNKRNIQLPTNIPKPKVTIPASLMMATKSSLAKMVPKIAKEPTKTRTAPKKTNTETRAIGRSETFSKDDPTFGEVNN